MHAQIRFAPLIRVSTESQARKGESLAIQKIFIEKRVEQLSGIVPDGLWERYSGQEHATVGQERLKLERLLVDAASNVFDAVIVADASRWSRDNMQSKQGLEILRQNNIRFFIGGTEINLRSPQDCMFLGLSTEINEFFGAEQARKSLESRIERANQGIPVSGKLPFGRTFDPKTRKWGLDEDKAERIRWAAREYLGGRKMSEIATTLGMNHSNLWKILCYRCGDHWEQSFKSERLGTNQVIACKIPSILPDDTIAAIRAKGNHNRTFCSGKKVNSYLLSGYIFCSSCKYVLQGQTNHSKLRYYRHPSAGSRKVTCSVKSWVRADEIERAVLAHLFALKGNPVGMENAVKSMIPRLEELNALRRILAEHEKEIGNTRKEIDTLVKQLSKGILTETEFKRVVEPLRVKETEHETAIRDLAPRLANAPTEKGLRKRASMARRVLEQTFLGLAGLKHMKWQDARKLVERLFSGRDLDGSPLGVWMTWDAENSCWAYEIRAGIGDPTNGSLPMKLSERNQLLEIEEEYLRNGFDPLSGVFDLALSTRCT